MSDDRPAPSILLRPTGPLDAESCADLRQQLGIAFASGVTSVVVDLARVPSIDVTGLGVLAGAARHLRKRDGVLVVTNASHEIAGRMRINGLEDLLQVPASAPLRVVAGTGAGRRHPRSRTLSVVPEGGLKLPS